jgi:hypothetical protein
LTSAAAIGNGKRVLRLLGRRWARMVEVDRLLEGLDADGGDVARLAVGSSNDGERGLDRRAAPTSTIRAP